MWGIYPVEYAVGASIWQDFCGTNPRVTSLLFLSVTVSWLWSPSKYPSPVTLLSPSLPLVTACLYLAVSISSCLSSSPFSYFSSSQLPPLSRLLQQSNGEVVPSISKSPSPCRSIASSSFFCRLFTDRYALSADAGSPNCNPGDQTWCGGTWNSVREHLDYIQQAGFTASAFYFAVSLSLLPVFT